MIEKGLGLRTPGWATIKVHPRRRLRQKHCSELCSVIWRCTLSDPVEDSEGLPCEWRHLSLLSRRALLACRDPTAWLGM
jgi:hypothetical protein